MDFISHCPLCVKIVHIVCFARINSDGLHLPESTKRVKWLAKNVIFSSTDPKAPGELMG